MKNILLLVPCFLINLAHSQSILYFKHRLPPRGQCAGFDCPIVAEIFISSIVSRLEDDAQGFDCPIVAEITGLVVV